ncbi:unnamed protein product [Thlaspi arvense]|uniref:Uncharacterized protein n=1 Tax=Thlaspi arvense TaxID=13288 RepID=A0AAU9RUT9_THLAR|nr:unnamed protein product [Thlaspi arvense]
MTCELRDENPHLTTGPAQGVEGYAPPHMNQQSFYQPNRFTHNTKKKKKIKRKDEEKPVPLIDGDAFETPLKFNSQSKKAVTFGSNKKTSKGKKTATAHNRDQCPATDKTKCHLLRFIKLYVVHLVSFKPLMMALLVSLSARRKSQLIREYAANNLVNTKKSELIEMQKDQKAEEIQVIQEIKQKKKIEHDFDLNKTIYEDGGEFHPTDEFVSKKDIKHEFDLNKIMFIDKVARIHPDQRIQESMIDTAHRHSDTNDADRNFLIDDDHRLVTCSSRGLFFSALLILLDFSSDLD